MAQLVVAVGTAAAIGLTATPVEAHPEWETFRHRRMSEFDAPRLRTLVEDGLTALLIEQVTERERALKRARRDWERLDAAWERAQEVEQVVPSVTTAGTALCDAACIQCESGGDPQAYNPNGHWGLYQFDYQTWVAHGGNPLAYGSAPASEQHLVASRITYDAWTCN